MIKHIKIKDEINKHELSVSLRDLLIDIEPYAKDLKWSIYELDALVIPPGIKDYTAFEDKISNSEAGLEISRCEMLDISSKFSQMVNLILVSSKFSEPFIKYQDDIEWYKKYPIVIEIIDGDFWEIYSSNMKLILFLQNKFKNTEVIDLL